MYFDFEERYTDHDPIGGPLRRWDGLLLSVAVHVAMVLLALLAPALPMFRPDPIEAEARQPEEEPAERPRFVFVQPRVDLEARTPPQRAEDSDSNRVARSVERPPAASNPLPFARGNSAERVEAAPEERAAGRGPAPEPSVEPTPEETVARPPEPLKDARVDLPGTQPRPQPPQGGSLGEALKNLQKYVDQESFNNPTGQVQNLGPLQFDTRGIEFGPWIRRFVSQVRRNWFVPYAAMSLRGRVVLTFHVHRNGALTDVQVVEPSSVESFNTAARNALLASNPTEPLPPDYPEDKAFFTVTFYYNESPGGD
jgi:TonB family protein